jgi:hypothetical protein
MTSSRFPWRELGRRQYFLPSEHGSWIWWIGPFAIGLAAGRRLSADVFLLFGALLLAFLARQPASIVVKAASGRRPRRDLAPAAVWLAVYSVLSLGSLAALVSAGYRQLLFLAIPGVLVFAWHLWLVSRREERGQRGVELVAAGVLALAAPAAYWLSSGAETRTAWVLWGLCWLQSAASIVTVFLRLEQRRLQAFPLHPWREGSRVLAYHACNLAAGLLLALVGWAPALVPVAFLLLLVDAVEGVAHPPVGARPTSIGFRQLGASLAFVFVMILAYRLG